MVGDEGSNSPRATVTVVTLAFSVAVVLGWVWISLLAARLMTVRPAVSGDSGAQLGAAAPPQ